MMAANTDNRVKIKELVMIVAACLISVILYHVAGQVIEGIVSDTFLSAFLAEAVFAVFALLIVSLCAGPVILRRGMRETNSGRIGMSSSS